MTYFFWGCRSIDEIAYMGKQTLSIQKQEIDRKQRKDHSYMHIYGKIALMASKYHENMMECYLKYLSFFQGSGDYLQKLKLELKKSYQRNMKQNFNRSVTLRIKIVCYRQSIQSVLIHQSHLKMSSLNKINLDLAKQQEQSEIWMPKTHGANYHSSQRLQSSKQNSFTYYRKRQKWNNTQSRRYIAFLKKQPNLFDLSYQEKRKAKINVKMSRAIKTKNPTQCHSHHQKMMIKYGSLASIIQENLYLTKQVAGTFGKKNSTLPQNEDQMLQVQDQRQIIEQEKRVQQKVFDDNQCWNFIQDCFFQNPELRMQGEEE